jgi:DNA-binding response OmpR family regulator
VQFRFENQILDSDRQELWRGSELVSLEPQVFDVLLYLIQNRDRVVSKDDGAAGSYRTRLSTAVSTPRAKRSATVAISSG